MTTEKVNDLELVKLSDYFTPGKFRTIPGTAMTDRGWYYRDAGCV